MADASIQATFRKPFAEQSEFFRRKVALPSERWDDLLRDQHDAGFIVAGAMKADLVADLKEAIQKSIDEGKSIQWFRGEFDRIVAQRGWTGWTGSESVDGTAWRTRVIYSTNLRTSHAAGRQAQMDDPDVARYNPYVMFRHRSTENPRLHHRAWNGMVLRRDDPWVAAHATPMGFGCKCQWVPVNERRLRRMGKAGPDRTPPLETYEHVDGRTGQVHVLPQGVQYGWDYAPGKQAAATRALASRTTRLETLDNEIARLNVQALVKADIFARFVLGDIDGEFPVAVLRDADRVAIGAESPVVLLSQEGLAAHARLHPGLTVADHRRIQQIIDQGEVYRQGRDRLVYTSIAGAVYRLVLTRAQDGKRAYFATLFRGEDAARPSPSNRMR
ncbi:hypothetical protein H0A70_05185 [Alcaligenaceae bacterium]|nr:hypothetical protein [Alcaligenaceae bacterium]